ncbi:MAG: riboflavin synthase [Candidatus Kerfeldbacteria bacterium]|nr:riboflavin synthase [Candidatus Kerfeldbacteria bacterium]
MFTGIVQQRLTIQHIQPLATGQSVTFTAPQPALDSGDSILIQGICSTITRVDAATITVEYMPETIRCSTVGQWHVGQQCNMETPVTPTTVLSGWIVTGHIDSATTITALSALPDASITLAIPPAYQSLVMAKGCITIDGVNLTVAAIQSNHCTVKLIPYTLQHTTLGHQSVGNQVNIEFDYIAKIVQRFT